MKINLIKPNPNNPRIIKDDKFKKLVQSIKDFPQMLELRPIVIDENNIVLGGNMRLKACQELGIKDVPTIYAKDLTEDQKKEFIIKDNVGFGEWNWDDLANDWDEELLVEWGLDLPISFGEVLEAEEDDYDVPEGEIETDIVLGDLFEIGEHRLLCGDSTDSDAVAKLMNGEKADMVFTDPPYGMHLKVEQWNTPQKKGQWVSNKKNYTEVIGDGDDFNKEFINTIFASFPKTKEIFIWGADYFAELLPNKNDGSWISWDKRAGGLEDVQWSTSEFELCWSKQKHQRKIARIRWMGVHGMEKQDTSKRVHPTQKPIELAEWFFNLWGKENDLVADLFLGSGTTMVASHQLKRKCYGMELDPKYCQVIIDRMKKLDSTLIIKRNGIRQN
jgi:DNA modification methylase